MARKFVVVILGTFIIAGIASYVSAFNEAIPTKVGIQKGDFLWKLVAKAPKEDPFPIPDCTTSNPVVMGGFLAVGDSSDGFMDGLAPLSSWKLLGKCQPGKHRGYKYRNTRPYGAQPVRVLIVKERIIKIVATAAPSAIQQLNAPGGAGENDPAYIYLKVGNDNYCAEWGQVDGYFKEVEGKLLKEKDEPAPSLCASRICTENGDDPQCANSSDPCTDGTCAISGEVCSRWLECPYYAEQCCCHGTCL